MKKLTLIITILFGSVLFTMLMIIAAPIHLGEAIKNMVIWATISSFALLILSVIMYEYQSTEV